MFQYLLYNSFDQDAVVVLLEYTVYPFIHHVCFRHKIAMIGILSYWM